jgi:ribosomal protein L37E
MSAGKYRKEDNCLNCGFRVEKHYCSSCGQPNLELKETFWQFVSHSIAHYFHFDNKFFQTLKPLLSRPGEVTLAYLAGKRARYINPISMYIFVSILYFLVVYSPKGEKEKEKHNVTRVNVRRPDLDSLSSPLKNSGLLGKEVIAKTQQAVDESFDRSAFKELSFPEQTAVLQNLNARYKTEKSDSLKRFIKKLNAVHDLANDTTYAAYLARQQRLPSLERDNLFERYMKKRSIEMGTNAEVIQEQLSHNRPKVYFLFMPLMAFFIMLNFRRNNIRYLDHLIFTIHGMTAFFLVSIIVQPTKRFLFPTSTVGGILELALIAWICWYLFKSLKIFYQRKTSTTIWRMVWIIALYGISLQIAEMVVVNIIYYML